MTEFPKKHPTGLWVLFTTEMWERFAFYAMRAILVLYLVDVSTNEQTPGFGWTEEDAYKLYGWYTALVYLSPLLGGWIADRFLGQRRCVVIGGALMAIGEFFLAATEFLRIGSGIKVTATTDPTALTVFYIGLGLMILGNGFFKPCISVMVGQLYAPGDRKRDSAFSIFYMGINIGAFLSPLVAGTVAEKYGYHLGFLIAGFGMIFGLITFTLFGRMYLKGIGAPPVKDHDGGESTPEEHAAREQAAYEQTRPLVKEDWDRMYVIVVLSIFVIAFWASFEQAGSSLNIFAKNSTNRGVSKTLIEALPTGDSGFPFLDNEDFVDYKKVVERVRALEGQYQREKAETVSGDNESGGVAATTGPVREPFADRVRRLFAFAAKTDDRPIDEQVEELKQIARELDRRLRKSGNADVQQAIESLRVVIAQDDAAIRKGLLEALDAAELRQPSTDEKGRVYTAEDAERTRKGVAEIWEAIADQTDDALAVTMIREGLKTHNITLPAEENRDKRIAAKENDRTFYLSVIADLLAHEQGADGRDIQTSLTAMEENEKKFLAHYVPGETAFTFPATWYQSVNACGIVIFVPVFTFLWIVLAARGWEPSTPYKFALGLLLVSASFFIMIPGAIEAKVTSGKAGPHWLVLCYLLATWGELCLSPVGLSMVTKLAPARYASFFMGVWFFASSVAYLAAGYLASIFGAEKGYHILFGPDKGLADFFLLMAVIPLVIGLIALALAPKLKRMMHGIR